MRTRALFVGITCLGALGGIAAPMSAAVASEQVAAVGQVERATMMRLLRPMTVDLTDQRFQDVVEYITNVTGAEIDALWIDDSNAIGLDPDQTINLRARNASALSILERALEQSATAFGEPGSATWQFTKYGTFEIGPKERLNKHRRVELYDINDLLFEIPDFADAPTFDLNSVLQSSGGRGGGGGSGQSPFQNTNQQNQNQDRISRDELATNIIDVITSLTETEQWEENGGDGGSIRFFQGHLLVNAPDYMHRGINGYRWWPKRLTQRASAKGNNAMTFTSDELRKQKDTLLIDPTQVQKPVRGETAKPADG